MCLSTMRISFVIAVLVACGDVDPCPPLAQCDDMACLADRCERGEIAVCAAAARALASSTLRSDRQRAVHLHELACARGSAGDCDALATALSVGAYIDKDLVRAAALRTRLCDQGVAGACSGLQWQYRSGEGVPLDEARADRLQWRACELGSAKECEWLAQFGKPELFQRAFDLSLPACHAGDAAACWFAHDLFSNGHAAASVPYADWAALAAAKTMACAARDLDACYIMATLLASGKGIREDRDAAHWWHTRACDLGSARSCNFLAHQRGDSSAVDLYVRACQLGDADACLRANPRDPAMDRAVLLRGCELGASWHCVHAMKMLDQGTGGPVDHAGARRLQSEACSQGHADQCFGLASDARERGDIAAERVLQRRACRAGQASGGCRTYATMLRKACDDSDAASCQELDRFLAALTPGKRDVAAFACCREQRGIAASPAGQLAAFADALARRDAKAVRAFLHPRRGMTIRLRWETRHDYGEPTFKVHAKSLDLNTLDSVVPPEIDAIECPDAFDDDAATCTWWVEGVGGTYQLLRERGRMYLLAVDVRNDGFDPEGIHATTDGSQ
jgi:TPR repeat protein